MYGDTPYFAFKIRSGLNLDPLGIFHLLDTEPNLLINYKIKLIIALETR
jgi:hypothetical protein